ncbi:MAG TPA: enoyl-CoA hydratase/isomerase family protein [Rhizobacter sp.]|jgi:enoyl-CoA hydratase/carnithine racemase|nr:enoyl-CoA hydratase/isomerase family protein [Rhizobacter sp.]
MATVSIRRIRLERHAHYLRLRLHRPDRYNAIDSATLRGLARQLEAARHEALPLVLAGEGDLFSVGADINELATLSESQATLYSRLGHQVIEALESWPGVTIAHLSGYALGAGLELALGCDVILASSDVRIGLPGLAWALVPCMGGLRRMACRASERFSSELFLQGAVLDAEHSLREHLIDRIVADEAQVDVFAYEMSSYSTSAVRAIRSLRLDRQGRIDSATGARMFSLPFASGECQRRLKALLAS